MKKIETSKIILFIAGLIFIVALISIPILQIKFNIDVASYSTQYICSTGAIFGCAIASYYNKAKLENGFKIKQSMIEWEYNFKRENGLLTQLNDEISNQVDSVTNIVDESVNSQISEAINEDVNVGNI